VRILVVNAGSSSLKLRVVGDDDETTARADLAAPDASDQTGERLRSAIEALGDVDAVGHRVVHGGTEFRAAILVDDAVIERLASLADLAPLHQPGSVAAVRAARTILPDVPHVACFDTAFHATIPDAAATYALPRVWRDRWPIRRFGFHGLSHAYAARRAAGLLRRPAEDLRLVTAHLGAGASLAAVAGGRSVDTTMGFTPLEGLVMATRSGSVDPGLLLWLQRTQGLAADELAGALEHDSGLLGLGGTADMRELLAAADAGSNAARLAREVYVHRLRAGIASMAAAMNGLDALVFTGGVGENAPAIRAQAVEGLRFLGLGIDPDRNERGTGDRDLGRPDDPARVLVVESREELEIARSVREALGGITSA
jgi:acetate kinase